jgi:hypothetical protein
LNGTDFKFNAEDIESIYLVEVGLIAYTVERDGSHINMEKFISKCGPEGVFETGTMLREFANKDAQDAVDSCCQL